MKNFIQKIKRFFTSGSQHQLSTGKRVLTIEDDPLQRTMIRRTLEKRGFQVLEAADGKAGWDVAVAQLPDVIILDVLLPKIRGEDVCKILKADPKTKNIPVLFLTSLDSPKDIIDQYDIGGEVHLTKPINPKELISQVEISLNLR